MAEYLAFEQNMHILVILTDMTSFAEAMREVSKEKFQVERIPDICTVNLSVLYERAGIVQVSMAL